MAFRFGRRGRGAGLAVMAVLLGANLSSPALLAAGAETVPVSQRLVSGVVTLRNGQELRFKTLEGGLVSFREEGTGKTFGLTPILSKETNSIEVAVFEITEITPGNDRIQQIDRFMVVPGATERSKSGRPFQVRIEGAPGLEVEAGATGAWTRAVSGRILAGTVTLPNGQEVGFKSVEGELVTLKDQESGKVYGLTPVCEGNEQKITLFEITDVGQGDQKIRQLEKLALPEGLPVESETISGFRITLGKPGAPRAGQEKANRCCVTCGIFTACACAASLDCGSCCSGSCCEPENRTE